MQQKKREAIETFLKKAGFWKISGKEKWCESKTPHMKVVSLEGEIPDIYLSTGTARQEAEECGVGQLVDYKNMILQIYNSSELKNEKLPEAGSHILAPPQEQEVSEPPPNSIPVPVSGGESHQFICSKCKSTISAEQRAATVKAVGKALCEACIHKTAEELAEKMKPKEDIKAPEPKPEPAKETKTKTAGKKKDEPKTEKKTETPILTQQGAEPIKPVMCQDCGFELSHIRALEYQICEDCAEKRRVEAEKIVPLKPREKIMNEKPESKEIVPAGKGANVPAVKSDHERDMEIERAKAKRYLEGQGGSYKVNGNEIPDSARVQNIANETGISVQILETEQNDDYARVRVRGNLGNQYVDGEVWVDFRTETDLLMMEFINKNPGILKEFNGLNPVFIEGAKIKNFDGSFSDAKYALVHAMLTLRKFAVRTAATKASKIVQMKLLNKEFREKEEIADEQSERDLVDSKKRK